MLSQKRLRVRTEEVKQQLCVGGGGSRTIWVLETTSWANSVAIGSAFILQYNRLWGDYFGTETWFSHILYRIRFYRRSQTSLICCHQREVKSSDENATSATPTSWTVCGRCLSQLLDGWRWVTAAGGRGRSTSLTFRVRLLSGTPTRHNGLPVREAAAGQSHRGSDGY